ncbi:MAG: DUF1559 domain-containing protein [Planctomycetaceae bacterium]|nr:DUF1559 domain-containing protein [Planctomycetaceae bacterium]
MLPQLLGDLCARFTVSSSAASRRRRRIEPPVAALVELLESRELLSATPVIIDNGGDGFSNVRDWQHVLGSGNFGSVHVANATEAGALATWDFTGLENGQYYLQATWTAGTDRATNALFTARSSFGAQGREFTVNQRVAPAADFLSGLTRFQTLGVVTVREGKLLVELTNSGADGKVIADAVRLAPVSATDNSVAARTERLNAITQALFAYHEIYSQLPPTPVPGLMDPNGRLLSWRVHLLPFLGYEDLYRQFHLNEAWDSPNNLPLLNQMPDVFRSRDLAAAVGTTGFQRADFPGGFHITGAGGPTLPTSVVYHHYYGGTDVTDNSATTLLLLETAASKAVAWTAPDDSPYLLSDPLSFRGAAPSDFSLAVMTDGKVRQLNRNIAAADFLALATWSGGEVLSAARVANIFVDPAPPADIVSKTKLQQLMLAMHNYHDVYGKFPAGRWDSGSKNYDANGNPYLSWRVHLLPYIGEEALYKRFRLQEAWDSPHNLQVAQDMPELFRSSGMSAGSVTTGFQVFRGPDAYPLKGTSSGYAVRDVTDGMQNTLGIIELAASSAQFWTRPDGDIAFNAANPLPALGAIPSQGWFVGMMDGSVHQLSAGITAANLAALVTPRGFEVLGPDEFANAFVDHPRAETIAAREEKLRAMGIAMYNYEWSFERLPVTGWWGAFDSSGAPLLGWRVHILPYLGEGELYTQFHLDEPWNSPHNLSLLDKMPDVFRSRGLPIGTNRTGFQLLTGPDAFLQKFSSTDGGLGPRLYRDTPDGTSNTILIVETQPSQAVEWTRPDGDLPFDLSDPLGSLDLSGLKNLPADGVLVLMADVSVRNMRPDISAADFAAYATWRGVSLLPIADEYSSAARADRSFFGRSRSYHYSYGTAASEQPVINELRTSQVALRQMMVAMYNYNDTFNQLPMERYFYGDGAAFDANGNPELSWRVHLLPFLDQGALYSQFNLTEPWDSPHNLPLLDQMPEIFRSRGLTDATNLTGFQIVTGPTAYNTHILGNRRLYSITDGTSNTIGIIETPPELAVPWTKPDDFEFNPADPFADIRALITDYLAVAMLDGSVRSLHPLIAPADAAALITWRSGDTSHYPFGSYYSDYDNFESLTAEIQITDSTGAKFQNETNIAAFGATLPGTPVSKTFTVKNTGSQTLNISSIQLPAGYTLTSALAAIAPGATLALTIRLDAVNPGAQEGVVSVLANVPHQPVTKFMLSGTVGTLTPTVSVVAFGGPYNGNPYAASATATGSGALPVSGSFAFRYYTGATATGAFTTTPPVIPGTYTVVAEFTSADPSYGNGTSGPVTFTITPLMPTVVASHPGGVYNGDYHHATVVMTGVTGFPLTGYVNFRYFVGASAIGPSTRYSPVAAGTYTVVADFFSLTPVYSNTQSAPFTFTITAATPNVVLTGAGGVFNGAPYPATASTTGIGGVTVSGTTTILYYVGAVPAGPGTTTPPTNVGTYTAVATFASSDPNYGTAVSSPVTFAITPAPLQFGLSNTTVNDNQLANALVGTFQVVDPNIPSASRTWTYAFVTGTGATDNARFTIDSSGNLRTVGAVDYEVQPGYTVRVRGTSSDGLVLEQAFAIAVVDLPEINLSSNTVTENQLGGTLVGLLSMPNPVPGRTYTYSLVKGIGGADNGSFAIGGSSLTTKAPFNFEAKSSYTIRVRSTESVTKRIVDQVLLISVLNVNEAPTGIVLSSTSVPQNRPVGTLVGAFSALSAEAGNTYAFALVPGTGATDNGRFAIDAGGNLRTAAAFVYDKKSKGFSIRVRVTDQLGRFIEQILKITVTK